MIKAVEFFIINKEERALRNRGIPNYKHIGFYKWSEEYQCGYGLKMYCFGVSIVTRDWRD